MSLTPEQIEIRSTGVGGSEAPAACGLSPYEQTVELYLRKIGEAPQKDETEEMLFGTCIEHGGIEFWSKLNGIPVKHPMPIARHPEYQFILATPDGEISESEGLEFKSMNWRIAKQVDEYGLAEICPQYVLQAQQQMAVMGWSCVRLVALVERKVREWPIERNDRLIRLMIDRESVFWDHVQRRVPPDVDFTKAGALRAVQSLYHDINPGVIVPLDEESTVMWEAYVAAGKKINELKAQQEQLKAAVLSQIGNNFAGVLATGDRMIRRQLTKRKGYTVEQCEYWDVRAVKYTGQPISELPGLLPESESGVGQQEEVVADDPADVVRRMDFRLQQAGFVLVDSSPSGSRYYLHKTESLRVRLSDHAPNEKTAAWMERQGIVREVRVDEGLAVAAGKLDAILSELEPAAVSAT